MTEKTNSEGKRYTIAELPVEHPYSFDTRLVEHQHLPDGSIVRLDTMEQFNGKTKVKTMTKKEFDTAMGVGVNPL